MDFDYIVEHLYSLSNPENVAGMARFGISSVNTLGISMPEIRKLAKIIKKNHPLALQLWDSEIHEARILAGFIAEPILMDNETMEKWVSGFDSWDVCDQVSGNLFNKVIDYKEFIFNWAEREEEFVRRTAFAMIVASAVHHKKANDYEFLDYLPLIINCSTDERNFVKKAVNWALRQIGKRSMFLNSRIVPFCEAMLIDLKDSKSAKWIARDAIRELTNEKTISNISRKNKGLTNGRIL